MAAFPVSLSVVAERIYSLLTPLNNLESNVYHSSYEQQHFSTWQTRLEGPMYEAGRRGSVSCLLPQISCDLGWIASSFFSYQFRISEDNPYLPSCFLYVVTLTSVGSRLPYMPAHTTLLTGAMYYLL